MTGLCYFGDELLFSGDELHTGKDIRDLIQNFTDGESDGTGTGSGYGETNENGKGRGQHNFHIVPAVYQGLLRSFLESVRNQFLGRVVNFHSYRVIIRILVFFAGSGASGSIRCFGTAGAAGGIVSASRQTQSHNGGHYQRKNLTFIMFASLLLFYYILLY